MMLCSLTFAVSVRTVGTRSPEQRAADGSSHVRTLSLSSRVRRSSRGSARGCSARRTDARRAAQHRCARH
jgi:hypothetical protein